MAAATIERLTEFYGNIPARGTLPIGANTKVLKGTLVGINNLGFVYEVGKYDSLVKVLGKASATFDNTGGDAGALNVEIEYGTFGWVNGTNDGNKLSISDIGKIVFALDNQTVAKIGTLIAGVLVDVKYGLARVWCGPFTPYEVMPVIPPGP